MSKVWKTNWWWKWFCKYCGSKINGEMVSRNNFVVQRQSTEHTKSKAEFISDYRAKHSERMVYTVLFIIFEIVATIVFIMNVSSYIDYHRDDNLIGMIISVFIEVIAIIFACAIKNMIQLLNRNIINIVWLMIHQIKEILLGAVKNVVRIMTEPACIALVVRVKNHML